MYIYIYVCVCVAFASFVVSGSLPRSQPCIYIYIYMCIYIAFRICARLPLTKMVHEASWHVAIYIYIYIHIMNTLYVFFILLS